MNAGFKLSLMTATLLVAGTLMTGCGKKAAAGPKGPPPTPEVSVLTIQPQAAALTTELPGRTSAYLVAEVRPQVNGIVQKRLFAEGSDVQEGDVLYQIDPATYQAAYASAKAALTRAEASLLPVKLKADRYKDLVKMNAVSKQDYDEAYAHLKQAEAEIEAAKAAADAAKINLNYSKVKAPISGRIGRSLVTTGALVTANQPAPLSTIQRMDPVFVDVTQSAAELLKLRQTLASGKLKKGNATSVKLLLEDGTPYPLTGTLKFSDVTVDQSTGSVTLRTVFPNPKQTLLPGMYVRAVLQEGVNDHAIMVPQRAVTRNPAGNAMCFVVGPEDKVEPRVIKVERTVGENWLVSAGLKTGDRVIMEGIQKGRPGTKVKVVPFVAKAEGMPGAANPQAGEAPKAGAAQAHR